MDDKERQTTPEAAQQAREKGAALEYDAEDEDALAQSAAPSSQKDEANLEEK